jgi:hypothetical protein
LTASTFLQSYTKLKWRRKEIATGIVVVIIMFLCRLYLKYSPSTKNRLVISVQGGKFNGPTAHILEIKLHFSSHTYPPYPSGGSDPFASVRLFPPQHIAFQTATSKMIGL